MKFDQALYKMAVNEVERAIKRIKPPCPKCNQEIIDYAEILKTYIKRILPNDSRLVENYQLRLLDEKNNEIPIYEICRFVILDKETDKVTAIVELEGDGNKPIKREIARKKGIKYAVIKPRKYFDDDILFDQIF